MSFSFTDVVLAVEAPDQPEVAQFSSTTEEVRLRLFTNNNLATTNETTGIALGTSNDTFYVGQITEESNVTRALVVAGRDAPYARVWIPPVLAGDAPELAAGTSNLLWVGGGSDDTGLVVAADGTVGVGTSAVAAQALTVAGGIYADSLTIAPAPPGGPCNVLDFNGATVNNVGSLHVLGDISATGNFYVTDTQTTVTDQLSIQNAGTGPGLVVNQTGPQPIAYFQDDSNTVFFIQDGGSAGFGNFGDQVPFIPVPALVYLENPEGSNQAALYVRQKSAAGAASAIVELVGPGAEALPGASNVIVTAAGRIGFGTASPAARLDIQHQDANIGGQDGPLLRVATAAPDGMGAPVAFFIAADGTVGFGTSAAPITVGARLTVRAGGAETEFLATDRIQGLSSNTVHFAVGTALSNIGAVQADSLRLGALSADPSATPVLTVAESSNLIISTGAAARIGFGTDAPRVFADFGAATDGVLLPRGTEAQRPGAGAGAGATQGTLRYNTDTMTFEGYGAGDTWGSLGGVKSTDGYTYITAEATPGANDSNLRFYTAGLERARITPTGLVGIGTTEPVVATDTGLHVIGAIRADLLEVATIQPHPDVPGVVAIHSNATLEVTYIAPSAAAIAAGGLDFTGATLSNIAALRTQRLDTSDGPAGVLDASAITLSNVAVLRVNRVDTSDAPAGVLDASAITLSNVAVLQVSRIDTTDALGGVLDTSGVTFSNLSLIEVAKLRGATGVLDADGTYFSNVSTLTANIVRTDVLSGRTFQNLLDASGVTLSNVGVLEAARIAPPAAGPETLLGPGIDFSSAALSNVGVLSVAAITTDAPDGILDFRTTTASNLTAVSTERLTVATIAAAATAATANTIDVSGASLSNIGTLYATTLAPGTLDTSGVALSNLAEVSADLITVQRLQGRQEDGGVINLLQSTLSNVAATDSALLRVARIASLPEVANGVIDFSSVTLSNVGTLRTPVITSDGPTIDVDQRTLSNVATLRVTAITPNANATALDFTGSTLSNVDTLRVSTIATDTPDGIINAPVSLSNIQTVYATALTRHAGSYVSEKGPAVDLTATGLSNVSYISVSRITTDALVGGVAVVDADQISLSNLATVRLVRLTTESQSVPIDFDQREVSNVSILRATELRDATILAPAGGLLDVSGATLSNVGTLRVATILSDTADATLNFAANTLSNVAILEVGQITTRDPLAVPLDFSGVTLSNVAALSVRVITPAPDHASLDFSAATVSNVGILRVARMDTDSVGGAIDVSNKNLSNVGTLSLRTLTTDDAVTIPIDVSGRILSNVEKIHINTICTDAANSQINFSGQTLSNVANLYVQDTLYVSTHLIADNATATLDANGMTLANVGDVQTTTITASRLTATVGTPGSGGVLDATGLTLSNVALLRVARIAAPESDAPGAVLDFNQTMLSNVQELAADTVTVRKITPMPGAATAPGSGLDFSAAALCNITRITVNPGAGGLYTNVIGPASDDTIDFQGANLVNVSNLDVLGVFRVLGEVTVNNVSTCNFTQMVIDHSGVGPGLIVNQNGPQPIVHFTDDGASVFFIQNGGRVGLGTTSPSCALDIRAVDALRLPTGTEAQRPGVGAAQAGHVRYNTDTQQYEGYGAGNSWGSLGGVKSTDQYTYITAEITPGANDSNLRFYTSGLERARITPGGVVAIGTTTPAAGAALHVIGSVTISGEISASNLAASATTDTTDATNITSGTLDAARLAASGVAAATYGAPDAIPLVTVDVAGRVTLGSNTPIYITSGQVSGLAASATTDTTDATNISSGTLDAARLAASGVAAATYGAPDAIPLVTVDVAGRVTLGSNTPIYITSAQISGLAPSATTDTTDATNISSGTLDAARLAASGVAAATYGAPDAIPLVTVDVAGRVTLGSNTPIYIAAAQVSGLAASATTDTTDATNISSGTLDAARLAASGVAAATYGAPDAIPLVTVDVAGRVTLGSNTPIYITSAQVSGLAASATTDTTDATNISSGTLDAGRLAASGVAAATYGAADAIPLVTVDVAGRVTLGSNTPIYIAVAQVSGLAPSATTDTTNATNIASGTLDAGRLPTSGVAAATYGAPDAIPLVTVDATGRVTAGSNTPIYIAVAQVSGLAPSATTDTTDATNISSGTLDAARLAASGVVAATYGAPDAIPLVTVDVAGRVTVGSNTPIYIASAQVSGLAASATTDTTNATNITSGTLDALRLPTSGVSAGTFGSFASIPILTLDATGRVTAASNTDVYIGAAQVTGLATVATSGDYNDLANRTFIATPDGSNAVYGVAYGNVGIGVNTPHARLHVVGDAIIAGTLTASNFTVIGDFVTIETVTSNTDQIIITNDGTGPALKVIQIGVQDIAAFYDDDTLALLVADGGYVGIGTNAPDTALHVIGAATVSGTVYASNLVLTEPLLSSQWTTSITDPAEIYYNSGNVGIGTATPTARLHVVGDIFATQSVSSLSDAAVKTNVTVLTNALETVKNLRGVRYDRLDTGAHEIGVIAQELEAFVPEVVTQGGVTRGVAGLRAVAYGNLTALLIEAVKSLSAEVTTLRREFNALRDASHIPQ